MIDRSYKFSVQAEDQAAAGQNAMALADILREADGVTESTRGKADDHTMDLGVIVSVLATSGATLAIARGLAAWLQARRGVTVIVDRDSKSESLKAAVTGLDPEAAARIIETIRKS